MPAPAYPPATESLAPGRCPLCGGRNHCALDTGRATGAPQTTCWCMTMDFDPAVLAPIPHEKRGQACICAACAARTGQPG